MEVNYLAVLVSGIAAMALGAFWYSPAGFGTLWMKEVGLKKEDIDAAAQKGMAKYYFANFVAVLILFWIFASQFAPLNMMDSAQMAFWIWLGFMVTKSLSGLLWEGRSLRLLLINTSYDLISLLIGAIIIGAWR